MALDLRDGARFGIEYEMEFADFIFVTRSDEFRLSTFLAERTFTALRRDLRICWDGTSIALV